MAGGRCPLITGYSLSFDARGKLQPAPAGKGADLSGLCRFQNRSVSCFFLVKLTAGNL